MTAIAIQTNMSRERLDQAQNDLDNFISSLDVAGRVAEMMTRIEEDNIPRTLQDHVLIHFKPTRFWYFNSVMIKARSLLAVADPETNREAGRFNHLLGRLVFPSKSDAEIRAEKRTKKSARKIATKKPKGRPEKWFGTVKPRLNAMSLPAWENSPELTFIREIFSTVRRNHADEQYEAWEKKTSKLPKDAYRLMVLDKMSGLYERSSQAARINALLTDNQRLREELLLVEQRVTANLLGSDDFMRELSRRVESNMVQQG